MIKPNKLERYTKVVTSSYTLCGRNTIPVRTEVSITDLRGLMDGKSNITLKNIKPITEIRKGYTQTSTHKTIQFLSAIN